MIDTLDAELEAEIEALDPEARAHVAALIQDALKAASAGSPSEFAERFLRFNEPKNRGPFTFAGREYLREVVDWWADMESSDGVCVFGSQSGKSSGIMAGAAWTVVEESGHLFWVLPTRDSAKKITNDRWRPMIEVSFPDLIPRGRYRHQWATMNQRIARSVIDFVWSNSPSALASVPASHVILDEVDKFNEGGKGEADAVDLAEQRTKNASTPKRMKTSTPTLFEGLIWQEFLKSDRRRRFGPCPHCRKKLTLIWSREYTVFPITGHEAPVVWDKEAKRKDGTWDLDRVERSARFECPHCGGHLRDNHKAALDAAALWEPTHPHAARGYRGWHLPSLWAPGPECGVGKLAVKFLNRRASLFDLQGFINGDLAEPYASQDTVGARTEAIQARIEVVAEWRKQLTVDCQAAAPYFWHIVRAWDGGNSTGLTGGPLDTWEDVEAVQRAHGIQDELVAVDSGYGARSDADVYKNCARHSTFDTVPVARRGGLAAETVVGFGWLPCKGFPGRKRWKDPETDQLIAYHLQAVDPFRGTAEAGRVTINLLEHADDFYEDILHELRRGQRAGQEWKVSAELNASPEYWRHLDGHEKRAVRQKNGRVIHAWVSRAKTWPDHLLDCERLQIVLAHFYKSFALDL